MPKQIQIKANLLAFFIIVTGFFVVALIAYRTSKSAFTDNIENVSALTSEGIYYRLEAVFAKPVNISLTMAASPLLKDNLLREPELENESYISAVQEYLNAYKEIYGYDTFFLASTKTQRFYTHMGVGRILYEYDVDSDWFYELLESNASYTLNVDDDLTAANEITVFVNCKIYDDDGAALGVVGVGLRVADLQSLLEEYTKKYNTDIYLVNNDGDIEVAAESNGFQPVDFFDFCGYPQFKDEILENREETLEWWLNEDYRRIYVTARYIPELNWHLIIEHDASSLANQLNRQLVIVILTAIVTGLLVFVAITHTTNKYNKQIITLTAAIEKEKQAAFRKATEQLYDNIYEFNITKNRAIGENTQKFLESLGMVINAPYDKVLKIAAQKVKEEYRDVYIHTFSPENVIREYNNGNTGLTCDLLSDAGDSKYYWLRIMAHIYYRAEDDSICMFTYRKNIDEEKRKEARLSEQAQLDGLTNVFNKIATERQIGQMLMAAKEGKFAFFIIDIDCFKQINDKHGHLFGDFVIAEFAAILKSRFRDSDIIGRIGGDEFAVFFPVSNEDNAIKKAAELSKSLDTEISNGDTICKISASIGVSTTAKGEYDFETLYKNADTALYEAKRRGRNGYSVSKAYI